MAGSPGEDDARFSRCGECGRRTPRLGSECGLQSEQVRPA